MIETSNKFFKVRVEKDVIQERLKPAQYANGSKAVLSSSTARSIGADSTLTVTQANTVIDRAVDGDPIQEKLKAIRDATNCKAVLSGR